MATQIWPFTIIHAAISQELFEHMYRALSILKVSAGENHPDIAALYLNLGLMYQDFEHFQAAIDCFLRESPVEISLSSVRPISK
jgi:tetratricopeptide (TPR) repeat protein